MGEWREADIVISGVPLTPAQSMAVRVAVTDFLHVLADAEHMKALGAIGPAYRACLGEVQDLILKTAR